IIDRRYATKFPGNMLERPSLLLNPWAVRDTETGSQIAAGGDLFGTAGGKTGSDASRAPAPEESAAAAAGHLTNLDFLRDAVGTMLNLVPDESGRIVFKKEALGPHQHLHV